MKIIRDHPPNYEEIKAKFDPPAGVIFCWGSLIFNPDDVRIPPEILIHEGVHSKRQGDAPGKWWDRYIANDYFRLWEEVPAHQAEFRFLNARGRNTDHVAERLASPLYGSMVSVAEAAQMIRRKLP